MTDLVWPCGTLGKAHGLHGEIYLELLPHGLEYLEAGERFALSRDGEEPLPIEVRRVGGDPRRPLLRLGGVETREAVIALSGSLLLASGGTLDELPAWRGGDLLGLRAEYEGRGLGVVSDILQAPAADVLEITAPDGEKILVPLVEELVTLDLDGGRLVVREGLL